MLPGVNFCNQFVFKNLNKQTRSTIKCFPLKLDLIASYLNWSTLFARGFCSVSDSCHHIVRNAHAVQKNRSFFCSRGIVSHDDQILLCLHPRFQCLFQHKHHIWRRESSIEHTESTPKGYKGISKRFPEKFPKRFPKRFPEHFPAKTLWQFLYQTSHRLKFTSMELQA